MGGITSNAIYLASSLTAASNVSPAAAETPIAPIVVNLSPQAAQPITPLDRGYVILDVPAPARSPTSPNLGELINAEIRQRADRYATVSDAIGSFADTTQGRRADEPSDVDRAVLAEHEARISFLKQRIASLRAGDHPSDPTLVHDLATRLKRAEAARKLAMARTILTGQQVSACAPRDEAACGKTSGDMVAEEPSREMPAALVKASRAPRAKVATVNTAVRFPPPTSFALPRKTASRRALSSPHGRSLSAGTRLATVMLRAPHLPHARAKGWKQPHSRYVVALGDAAAARRSITSAAMDRASAYRLTRARRLLSKARGTLIAVDARHAVSVKAAGLWQWEGSDNWSLASYRNRAT